MAHPFLTVAICTWNRAASLRRTLDSLCAAKVPTGVDWELLIVNNNCTDDTDAVAASFSDRLPIRLAHEPRQGLSHARNRVVDEGRGDYILWTDDDVIVDAGWLAAYAHAFDTWPDAVLFGGPIIAEYEGVPPAWLMALKHSRGFGGMYALRDFGDAPVNLSISEKILPYGANYAVRTAEQRDLRYDPRLGMNKNHQGGGEETSVIKRMLERGCEGRWLPDARVRHVISRQRQSEAYIRGYFVGAGRTLVREGRRAASPSILGVPLWVAKSAFGFLWSCAAYALARPFLAAPMWFAALRNASLHKGALMEYWRGDAA